MTSVRVDTLSVSPKAHEPRDRVVPDETPIALVHDGATHAVMMATPADLEDFAVGFSLSEGVIGAPSDIRDLEIVEHDEGFELRMWLVPNLGRVVAERRRLIAGPTGCGLCGVESLQAACAPARLVGAGGTVSRADIAAAMDAMSDVQTLGRATRATHAAGFWRKGEGLLAVREDVGRHNALDKLIGYTARAGVSTHDGIVVITSRVSIEMVQKTAVLGAPVLAAISAPTALAVRTADAAGITLAAIVRGDSFEVFTHPHRILPEPALAAAG
ncbi:formate dehydrogenase accessory sulfurtransferase FdhD [Mongoliimonas terrestris]|uniref:formate dehydrogenase accessory sulfurtransferase FdhD n=1 Tax=Mongoliimonas terrestris TaxID=1709001 RepID=UPI0009499141|nr:formate dehydrogenase accessory sulfurtransferase FdhD [Mongoliimonas terrestris]